MNTAAANSLARLERNALIIAVLALLAAITLGWLAPNALAAASRFAVFVCLAPALGSLIFVLILQMTGGQWGPPLQPLLGAGVTLLPWVWLISLPLLLLNHATMPETAGGADLPIPPDFYGSHAMLVGRAMAYGVIFFIISHLTTQVLRLRRVGDTISLRWVGPVGLLVLVFMLHLLADDWLVSLEPGWRSTGFPLVWMSGVAVTGFAAAVFCAIAGGADPTQTGAARRPLGIDWGNLLLTATVWWCYVTFAQFLIIWSGNLPPEISWYLRRAHGGWLVVIVALAVFHFALPFLFLLSRRFKTFPAGLAGISLVLLVTQLAYTAWTILPAFAPTIPDAVPLALTLAAAGGGFFLNRYLHLARRFPPPSA